MCKVIMGTNVVGQLLPNSIAIFVAIQAAGLFWVLNSFVAGCLTLFFFSNKKLSSSNSLEAFSSAVSSLKNSVTRPIHLVVGYTVTLIQFLVTNYSWIIFALVITALSFVLLNYQQALIVLVDDTYENLYTIAILPIKAAADLFIVIIQIAIGLINFVSQYTNLLITDTTRTLMTCPGFFPNIFSHFTYASSSISNLAISATNLMNNKLLGPFELRTVIKPIRLMVYDASLRFQCACPADRGVLDIAITGVFDSTSVNVESFVHYSVNSIISIPQVLFASVIASASSGTYVPPNTDYVFDNLVGVTNYTEYLSNAVFKNGIGFIEGLITQAVYGTSSVPWPAIPVFSIPGREIVFLLEVLRVLVRTIIGAPNLFIGNSFAATGYKLLDGRFVYIASMDVSNALWYQNFGAIYKNYLLNFGAAFRDFTNIILSYYYFAYEGILRFVLGRVQGQPYLYASGPPFTGICFQPANLVYGGGFNNFWSAIFDLMGEYDRLITNSYIVAAGSLNSAFAPYYPPLGMSGSLALISWANYISSNIRKSIYILYSMVILSPPNYVCMSSMGRPTRVAIDNLIESLPDFTNFFLDITQAKNLRSAHFNCKDHNVHNYIYAGSMKAHYFASKMCNTRYIDGTLIQCDFFNASQCPGYEIAYADLNVNLLCATNEAIVQFIRTAIVNERIASGYAEKQMTKFIACLISPMNTTTCPQNDYVGLQQSLATASVGACASQELMIKLSNIVAALVSFGFDFAYKQYFGFGYVAGGTIRGNARIAYNEMTATAPEITAFVTAKKTDPSCSTPGGCCTSSYRQVSVANCYSGGASNICQWDGTRCTVMSAQHLSFQQYPLEAALSTLMISVLSGYMWGTYLVYEQGGRLATALEIDYTLPPATALSQMLTRLWTLIQLDPYFAVLESTRVSILYMRDVLIALVEFCRAFVYVFQGGSLPSQFVSFERTMIQIVNFIENIAMIVVNEGFKVLFDIAQFIMDFVSMVFDPTNAQKYMNDALDKLIDIVKSQLAMFKQLVLMIPGIDQICGFFSSLISSITSGITSIANRDIIPAINAIIGIWNQLQAAVTGGLNSLFGDITAAYNAAIGVAKAAIQVIINGVSTAVTAVDSAWKSAVSGVQQAVSGIDTAYKQAVGGVQQTISTIQGTVTSVENSINSIWTEIAKLDPVSPSSPVGSVLSQAGQALSGQPTPSQHYPGGNWNPGNWFGRRRLFWALNIPSLSVPTLHNLVINNPIQCPASSAAPIPLEATLCTYNSDCTSSNSYCFIDYNSQCNSPAWSSGNLIGGINMNDMWAKPCPCNQLTSGNAFCDFASGFCREGISPFADPISSCPASGVNAFVESTDYFNAMCWLFPAWKCSASSDATLTACITNNLLSANPFVTGPHLCRDFCSPDLFNFDNRLISDPVFGCVCAVGWSVGSGQPSVNYATNLVSGVNTGHRRLHFNLNMSEISNGYEFGPAGYFETPAETFYELKYYDDHYNVSFPSTVNGTTFCIADEDCLVPTTICDSTYGGRACASCPTRNFYSQNSGHSCIASRCVCDPIPDAPAHYDFGQINWQGTSKCALLGRAYGKETNMSTAVYVELRSCANKHLAGIMFGHLVRMPSLNPAIMYDHFEAMRFGAHLTVGLMVGGLFYNETDHKLWNIFSKLAIDPNIALPATRITGSAINQTMEAFPRTISTSKNLIIFIVNLFGSLAKLPSIGEMTNATIFVANMTKNAALSAYGEYNASDSGMKVVYDEIAQFRKNLSDTLLDYDTRRKILASVNVLPLSCPILTNFITDFGKASTSLVIHMTNNVPRSVCRMTNPGGGAAWDSCPKASWDLPNPVSPPPPSPRPPPKLAYPPPPSVLNTILPKNLQNGGFIQRGVFKLTKLVSGWDVASWLDAKMNRILNLFPTKTAASQKVNEVLQNVKCTYDTSVMCRTKDRTLFYHVFWTAVKFFAIIYVSSFLKIGMLTPAIVMGCTILFLPTVLKSTYGLPLGCSMSYTPVLPVCIAEDFQTGLYALLPQHIPWPAPLVNTHNRAPQSIPTGFGRPITASYIHTADVTDCSHYGFGDGTRELVYGLDYYWPSWREHFSSFTTSTFFGWKVSQEFQYFEGKQIHTEIYKQCAALFSITTIPLILFVILILTFSLAILHVAFVVVRNLLLAIKDLFRALALAFIDLRDN